MEQLRAQAMECAESAVGGALEILGSTGLDTTTSISVLLEPPKKIILDEAKEWKADLIVVGSHGRRGLDRFLLGSTAEAVTMHAHCSVDGVRSKGAK